MSSLNQRDANEEQSYFDALVQKCNADVYVRNIGPKHGRVTFARRAFARGEEMWREQPLLVQEDIDSRADPYTSQT